MERTNCVICNDVLHELYTLPNMPISLSVTTANIENDIILTQHVSYCKQCGCVQLSKLIDTNILYGTSHNLTSMLPTWNDHHAHFSKFILDSMKYESIIEIGGSSGALYNKIKSSNIEYSCIDICEPSFDTTSIKYIIGNCEEYVFDNVNCVAMSHVFEHLYNPNNFIDNIAVNNVKSIYISIPNMTYLLETMSASIIHYEHTFFIDKYFMEYLFSQKGYKLVNYTEFKNHSLFFEFEKTYCTPLNITFRESIHKSILNISDNLMDRFMKHTIPPNSFIVPGGHMGQLLYSMAKPTSILGFLDNDTAKHNKRQYGTCHYIYPFNTLNMYKDQEINIFIYAGPYTSELLKQLSVYNNINIIVV